MDVDEAIGAALQGGRIDKEAVREKLLQRLQARRRRRRVRVVAIAMGAVVVVLGLGITFAIGRPQARLTADGCSSLTRELQRSASKGQAVVTASGVLTAVRRTLDQTPYAEMRLTEVTDLNSVTTPRAMTVWIQYTPQRAPTASDAPGLWAEDGRLIGFITPPSVSHVEIGPLLRPAPLVDGQVVLSSVACWDDPSISGSTVYLGRLMEIPGSGAIVLGEGDGGFRSVALKVIKDLLSGK